MSTSIHVELWQVAASLVLVALAAAISFWQRAGLERDIVVATVRSIVQLTLVGYAIKLIFDVDSIWLVLVLLAVMVFFGAITARHRADKVPDSFGPLLIALALAGASTLGLVVALGIFDPTPRYLVPVGGMVIGNAMTASAVALNRLGDEMADARARIEATLALGATAREAAAPTVRRSLRSGMITLVDSTKTTGLIFFPGTMVGMLLAGASPTDAVRLQLILLYTLLGSVSISALSATLLAYRNFFTPAAQLRDRRRPASAGSTSLLAGGSSWAVRLARCSSRCWRWRGPCRPSSGRKSHWFAPGQATSRRLPSGDHSTCPRLPGTLSRVRGPWPGRKTRTSL